MRKTASPWIACLLVLATAQGLPGLRPRGAWAGEDRSLDLGLEYVASARVAGCDIFGLVHRTLIVTFREPQGVVSTLEGPLEGVSAVMNHGIPPAAWPLLETPGPEAIRERALSAHGLSGRPVAVLMTGADVRNLAVVEKRRGEMMAVALVTAGVRGNAMRMSREVGRHAGPGTVNIVILTNRRLDAAARARAVITASEAKTAAFEDLDVRSTERPLECPATGTGTDEVVVVEGRGETLEAATGGHTVMGGLIAGAVYEGVRSAARLQNGLEAPRDVAARLRERGLAVETLDLAPILGCRPAPEGLRERLKGLLSDPRHAAFLECALAISDAHGRGLVSDLSAFGAWCREVTETISGHPAEGETPVSLPGVPQPLGMALGAVVEGVLRSPPGARGAERDRHHSASSENRTGRAAHVATALP